MKKLLIAVLLVASLAIANEKAAVKSLAVPTAPAPSKGAFYLNTTTSQIYVSLDGVTWTRFANFLP